MGKKINLQRPWPFYPEFQSQLFKVCFCLDKKLNRALRYQEYCLVIGSSELLNRLFFCIAQYVIVWGILYLSNNFFIG